MEDNDSIEIIDTENYRESKDQQFSHQSLVMKAMNRCIETGTKEMRPGYYNEKRDKSGNSVLVYNPDTRKEFIESVKTAMMIMSCDIDEDYIKAVKEIQSNLKKEYESLCNMEKDNWLNANVNTKRDRWSKGIVLIIGSLNKNLPYYQQYIEFEVDCYRDIFAELTKLTSRKNFYQEEYLEA